MLKKSDIVAHLVCGCSDAGKHICHSGVHLAGVSLSGYRVALGKAHLLRDHGIDLVDGLLISVEQLQEGSLGSRGSLGAEKLHGTENIVQILQIKIKLLQPQSRTLSHGSGLCRLEVCECKGRLCLIFFRKISQLGNDIDQLLLHKLQSLCHHDNIGIVSHITACRTEMNDACCLGALLSVGVHMAHDIVTHFLFSCPGHLIIDILGVCLQFFNLFIRDDGLTVSGKSQFLLRLCQRDPQLSPGAEFHIGGENILHLPAGVTL